MKTNKEHSFEFNRFAVEKRTEVALNHIHEQISTQAGLGNKYFTVEFTLPSGVFYNDHLDAIELPGVKICERGVIRDRLTSAGREYKIRCQFTDEMMKPKKEDI